MLIALNDTVGRCRRLSFYQQVHCQGQGNVDGSCHSDRPWQADKPYEQNRCTNTPIAAPILFVKYSKDSVLPGSCGDMRMIPALISGKVIPRRIDWGRISNVDTAHL